MIKAIAVFLLFFPAGFISGQNLSFVFLPDIHLQPDSLIIANLDQVISQVNKLNPDFVITGGDMIYTAKNGDNEKAKELFDLMDEKFAKFKMPLYYTIGNHEVVGILPNSGIDGSHPQWGKQMYEQRYGRRYKSFEFSGWKFFLLDGIIILKEEMNYTQGVDSLQMLWIKKELKSTDSNIPIVVSIHTPLINPKAMTSSGVSAISKNAEAVLDLFDGHNLKMVLQGHNHIYMDLFIRGVHFISGGSTLYDSDLRPFDDGFVQVRVKNNHEEIRFIPTARTIPVNE